ncbi:MAG TPA: DUF3426 domain-containing protein [Steroidobacteraceae bacterium]
MFTVCPKCTLTLVVTTVDLRAGQGYVRCGRCANVFNALIALREGDPGGSTSDTANRRLQETASSPPLNPAVGAGVADREPEPEPEPEPAPEPDTETALEASPEFEPEPEAITEAESEAEPGEESLEFDATATDVSEIFIAPENEHTGSGTFETVVLADESAIPESASGPGPEHAGDEPEPADDVSHTDTIAADDWSLLDDEPVADAESVIEESPLAGSAYESEEPATELVEDDTEDTMNVAVPQPDPPWVEEMFAEAEAEAERTRTAEREALLTEVDVEEPAVEAARAATGSAAPSDTVLEPLLSEPAKPRSWKMTAGIAGLALLLVAQVVHFNRQSLVLNQTIGPALSSIYGWFGATPTPRWDLTAYSVKQLGAEAEGGQGTRLRVRLSVQNDSPRVQPLPLLRLTLQDRYGNAVATRDLEPRDYLPPRAADLRLLEPDQRIDAELHVMDPGKAAIGFEIDACLRGEGGAIGCANDARRRAAG